MRRSIRGQIFVFFAMSIMVVNCSRGSGKGFTGNPRLADAAGRAKVYSDTTIDDRDARIDRNLSMTFSQMHDEMTSFAKDDAYEIGGYNFDGMLTRLNDFSETFEAMDATYSTLGEFLAEYDIDPRADVTENDYASIIEETNDVVNQGGVWADVAAWREELNAGDSGIALHSSLNLMGNQAGTPAANNDKPKTDDKSKKPDECNNKPNMDVSRFDQVMAAYSQRQSLKTGEALYPAGNSKAGQKIPVCKTSLSDQVGDGSAKLEDVGFGYENGESCQLQASEYVKDFSTTRDATVAAYVDYQKLAEKCK